MSELICDREFGVRVAGVEQRVVAEWFKPMRWRGDWRCEWTVHWPGRAAESGSSIGADSTQALMLALAIVGDRLHHEGATWLEGNTDLGLPKL